MKKSELQLTPITEFDYYLPAELIGQEPIKPRDQARLLVLNKKSGRIFHNQFCDLPDILKPGDVLVFNNSKVIPARLIGKKETGGGIEIFLLSKTGNRKWNCLIRGKAQSGLSVGISKKIKATVLNKETDGVWAVQFNVSDRELFKAGKTPLPPYIKKESELDDYQTVYAKKQGSVAAPTAGLHFTKPLLAKLKKQGIQIEFVTLHVGLGTFAPVKTDYIEEHKIHSEYGEIDKATAKRLNEAKEEGRRIIAVGTTSVRTLEAHCEAGKVKSGGKWIDIFIYPGYKFNFVDSIITNFHTPKSTLLMLVSAFSSKKLINKAYQEAIKEKYRFFSFGDGMMIE